MTLAELTRLLKAKRKMKELEMKERAVMDYKLADLIGASVARIYSSSAKLPELKETYDFLFNEEDKEAMKQKEQERKAELSAIRFKQFADSFNKRFTPKEEVAND